MVTNGALGLLPLSLLPTAPAQIEPNEDVLFASYRKVPWLARTHAVTMVPSSAALRTLRNLPPGKPERSELIAFGDPYFSTEQQDEAMKQVKVADASGSIPASTTTRGVPLQRRNSPKLEGVDSAELALLPRLPDTADELKSIALALQADPSKVLNLGKDANESKVKTTDLSGFKVLAFATHGLVPGELNGLTQPALALSAPAVSGVEGDGLLTMEEILALKLDADWVVLSACNTGAGAGAGAEAASGLGRAFFYAGTRALLVTNWSVHSQSATRTRHRPVQAAGADKNAHPRRSAAPGDDGDAGRPGLHGRVRQDRVCLRPSAVLGAIHHNRRWWTALRKAARHWVSEGGSAPSQQHSVGVNPLRVISRHRASREGWSAQTPRADIAGLTWDSQMSCYGTSRSMTYLVLEADIGSKKERFSDDRLRGRQGRPGRSGQLILQCTTSHTCNRVNSVRTTNRTSPEGTMS